MSPGFRPRPSLSVLPSQHLGRDLACVAGVQAPAFVERRKRSTRPSPPRGVAGVQAPAFVERAHRDNRRFRISCVAGVQAPAFVERRPSIRISRPAIPVSPGFRPRPSLSERHHRGGNRVERGVAGVPAPAFVERARSSRSRTASPSVAGVPAPAFVERRRGPGGSARGSQVSPGFRLRPSLSDRSRTHRPGGGHVSPGFGPRPSLSEPQGASSLASRTRVAGVQAPAFVERCASGPG